MDAICPKDLEGENRNLLEGDRASVAQFVGGGEVVLLCLALFFYLGDVLGDDLLVQTLGLVAHGLEFLGT